MGKKLKIKEYEVTFEIDVTVKAANYEEAIEKAKEIVLIDHADITTAYYDDKDRLYIDDELDDQ